MERDESPLRPCKPSPSAGNDHCALPGMMGQHPSSPSTHHLKDPQGGPSQKLASDYETDNEADSNLVKSEGAEPSHEQEKARTMIHPIRERPLRLLDLPLDVLKEILREVTHTNDLANLALVCSTLHGVVTPLIYSRFDIVWPDTLSNTEPRAGVDALTYGLATLVMREDLFDNVAYNETSTFNGKCQSYACKHCGHTNLLDQGAFRDKRHKIRRGNYFSQFTKKFSLGNGPSDWVQEYLVTKESGKMLGTLVALSIARMPNLETFVWDMPTGILRDIWISLASLGDYRPSKLEKLWVRLHDNKLALQEAGVMPANLLSQPNAAGSASTAQVAQVDTRPDADIFGVSKVIWSNHHVEAPNFSVVPPLKSLTVLNIDEIKYLTELSVLLGKSVDTLRELRLGMATTLHTSGLARTSPEMQPLFFGGVFSLLMSKIYDHMAAIQVFTFVPPELAPPFNVPVKSEGQDLVSSNILDLATQVEQEMAVNEDEDPVLTPSAEPIDPALMRSEPWDDGANDGDQAANSSPMKHDSFPQNIQALQTEQSVAKMDEILVENNLSVSAARSLLEPAKKLRVENLEVEWVEINPHVLRKSIDLTVLTSLTLLQCGPTHGFWELLSKEFPPRRSLIISPPAQQTAQSSPNQPRLRRKPSSESLSNGSEYQLNLKKIHTDNVSRDLIMFIKHTLAPNSLEWLFLQDNEKSLSPASLETIYRGPLRRHRSSLTKLMIDSAWGSMTSNRRKDTAKKWIFNREVLTFVTSGKMSKLRELALSLEYKDWHFFLQKLPNIPHLRSLYIPELADHPYGSRLNWKEFAMGAVDTVALRPECQLCYLGIKTKCFEILEIPLKHRSHGSRPSSADTTTDWDDTDNDDTETDPHNDDEDSEDEDDDDAPAAAPAAGQAQVDEDEGERSPLSEDEEVVDGEKSRVKFRLREILFYDDKISVFKARHGRL